MIPNFSQVTDNIWRGGQPETDEDWQNLEAFGVTQVIKLNEDSEAVDLVLYGMTLFKVQMPVSEQLITEPDMSYLLDAVEFICPGTFVHCKNGWDRTGLVIGLYRVLKQGWNKDLAYTEMLLHGFHPVEFGLGKAWEDMTKSYGKP